MKSDKTNSCRDQLLKITEKYYEDLYASKIKIAHESPPLDISDIPDIKLDEVTFALNSMKRGKAPGKDNMTTDLLATTTRQLWKELGEAYVQQWTY